MPAFLMHVQQPLEGMVRSQSLSPARLIFLISLVVFFTVLFVVVYIWMRKPGFGQGGNHERPAVPKKTSAPPDPPTHGLDSPNGDAVLSGAENIDDEPEVPVLAHVAR